MPQINPTQLRTALSDLFSTGELHTLCFDLGIEFEDLEGNGKSGKALALVQYAQRHGRYDELVYRVQQLRPHANLGTAVPAPPNIATQQGLQQVTNVYVGGDYIGGDKVGGDKIEGDKTSVGDITGSTGVTIGRGASSTVSTGPTHNISGTVIGSAIGGGEVHAENIAGGDINIYAEPKNKDEFNQQLQELKTWLEQALADGEIDKEDGETAVSDLQDVIEETEKETPRSQRMKRRLEDISEVISAGAKAGTAVLKATPIIAGLIKAIGIIF
ncbi:MAG: hypothetical protein H6667_11135 [Ardenticatenaceae bacterium]|nr:hypothetical protein [Ardenticatenaceae bacterium]MCB9444342.1 hypothetical protein [Ardenticatenaceae bacterium]